MKCEVCKNEFKKGYNFAIYKTKSVCQRCYYKLKNGHIHLVKKIIELKGGK